LSRRSVYCYCKNTYTVLECDCKKSKDREIWRQGIGRTTAIPAIPDDIFDSTFDTTFN
tara:strand:- start:23 stop:196 length:174 start_codon:yes stop_codon:yes gene_type:complete